MIKPCAFVAACFLLFVGYGCGRPPADFSRLSEEFVFTSLAFSPVTASASGLHQHAGKRLDEMLDDYSAAAIERQRQWYSDFRNRIERVPRTDLSAGDLADLDIIQGQISLALLELGQIQSYRHNPTLYVELVGNALFNPYVLEYAPKPERMRHIIARLEKIPVFLDQARSNLSGSPSIWTKVAMEENEGNINLVEKTLRETVPAELADAYAMAAKPALAALREFQDFLKNDLSHRNGHDWRLGRDRYTRKFRYVLATGRDPESVLADAESDLRKVRTRMLERSLALHKKFYPSHRAQEQENVVISEVLARVAERHSTPESYMPDARRDLDEAREFVKSRGLLTLPRRDNLQVIDTPEFMRGIYAVGGFSPAPPLEPHLGAFYWLTPIPKDWNRQRVESKLREYNFYKLKLLTIHEAIPGHYVQLEYANDVQPRARRLLRSIYGNGPYIEGWAQYATDIMLDQGFLDSSPELRLTFEKEELRVLANAIIDIRLQMLNMPDQEALDLMQRQTFQEVEEATAKLQRAKLSSAQLPTYYVGWRGWLKVRDRYRQAQGGGFRLPEFNDQALKQGAVPLPLLEMLLKAKMPTGAQSR